MNSQTLKYLQQDGIGKVIAKGLADLYSEKPQTPVKYLIDWLKKYSNNQKEKGNLVQKQQTKAEKQKQYNVKVEEEKKAAEHKITQQKEVQSKLEAFKKRVQNHDYQEELLDNELVEFIEKKLKLTGCYIGYVNHPTKKITDQDDDENAHLDTATPKLINYIGASQSHQRLMLGQTLPLDKGVTAAALNLSLDDPVPNEDGSVEVKDKYVYIPNVVKNEAMHYFRLPKLGSYIAVPLIYQSYLTENIFDEALEKRLKYLEDLANFQKTKAEQLKEIDVEAQGIQARLAELQQKGGDEAALQQVKAEIEESKAKRTEKQSEKFDEEHTELPLQKRQFIVCGDTLGQDREISLQDRTLFVELIKHFKDSWQKKQNQLLYKDVEYQIKILKNNEKPVEAILEHLQKVVVISPQKKAALDEIEDQTLREYRKSIQSLELLKAELKDGQHYLASFFKLKNFRVVKFKEVIQAILFFLKHKKEQINLPGKTHLNWKKVRSSNLYAETFFSILYYNPEGAKSQPYPNYCKINHISQILQKHNENDIFDYNIGLGVLVKLIKRQIAHRIANIQLRRHQKQKERQHRGQLLQENERITEQKRQNLQKHKQTLPIQQQESFKEQQWSAKYDEQNPLKQIPPEVIDDIDNDF